MNKDQIAQLYSGVLEDMGLVAKHDADGDVAFKYPELGTMFFSIDERDPEYMMLVFPAFADHKTLNVSRDQLLGVINSVNARNKAVKVSARESKTEDALNVSASIESFLGAADTAPPRALLAAVMKRNVSALRAGVMAVVQEARAITAAD